MNPLSTRLKALIANKNWNEFELSKQSGVSQPTVHRMLSGESKSPRLSNLASIAKCLNVSVAYLTEDKVEGEISATANEFIAKIESSAKNGNLEDEDFMVLKQLVDRLEKP